MCLTQARGNLFPGASSARGRPEDGGRVVVDLPPGPALAPGVAGLGRADPPDQARLLAENGMIRCRTMRLISRGSTTNEAKVTYGLM
jgi:hypothetical protein